MSSSESSPAGRRVDLPDGRWVSLRPLRGADLVAMSRDIGEIMERLALAVVDMSWEGDILEEEFDVLRVVLKGWRVSSEEAAVPPAPGESSP
ncbi:MAG: hypothetical protein EPN91_07955 [Salinibacterium sp.]|nr:MAG: hypothetical protein EPN91_07955 [Salinibacterium sp.]